MNFSEFKRLLKTDPQSPDPEYQAARRSEPEFIEAAAESDALEQKLRAAASLPVPDHWSGVLKALATANPVGHRGPIYRYRFALAALLVVALGAAVVLNRQAGPPESLEAYVEHHFGVDGYDLLVLADTPNTSELAGVLGNFKLQMSPELTRQVRFVKYCPTPAGMGIHLVLGTDPGLVTVILMPGQEVPEGERFAFHEMAALMFNLPGADVAAVIVAPPAELDSTPTGLADETLGASLALALQQGVSRQTAGA